MILVRIGQPVDAEIQRGCKIIAFGDYLVIVPSLLPEKTEYGVVNFQCSWWWHKLKMVTALSRQAFDHYFCSLFSRWYRLDGPVPFPQLAHGVVLRYAREYLQEFRGLPLDLV